MSLNRLINPWTWIDIVNRKPELLMNFKVIFHFEFLLKIRVKIIPYCLCSPKFIPVSCSGCLKIISSFYWFRLFQWGNKVFSYGWEFICRDISISGTNSNRNCKILNFFTSTRSIRIHSRSWDNFENFQLNFDPPIIWPVS